MTHCLTPRRPTERPEVGRLILVAERVAADYDRVGPARNETRDVVEHDRLAEDDTAQDVADCAVGRAPHLLETEFLDPCLVGRDGRAFDADAIFLDRLGRLDGDRSEEHTSELQSLMRISYAVFCLKKKTNKPSSH